MALAESDSSLTGLPLTIVFNYEFREDLFKKSSRWSFPVKKLLVYALSRKVSFTIAQQPGGASCSKRYVLLWEDRHWCRLYVASGSTFIRATMKESQEIMKGYPFHQPIRTRYEVYSPSHC